MLKAERKLVEFVEKHLFLLCILLLSLLALYLRKVAVWWNYDAIVTNFDKHKNYTQTAAYFLILRLIQYLPLLPVHSIKWMAGLADFGVAGLVTYLLGRGADHRKQLIFYTVILFSPVLYLRGIIWAQTDSVALLLLLSGYLLYDKKKKENKKAGMRLALVPVVAAIALCPCLFLVVLLYLWKGEGAQRDFWCDVILLTLGGLLVQLVCALLTGEPWKEGPLSCIRFLTYHPESGALYNNAAEWLLQMIYLYSPAAMVLTAFAAGKRRISYGWTISITIVSTVLYGANLFTSLP